MNPAILAALALTACEPPPERALVQTCPNGDRVFIRAGKLSVTSRAGGYAPIAKGVTAAGYCGSMR